MRFGRQEDHLPSPLAEMGRWSPRRILASVFLSAMLLMLGLSSSVVLASASRSISGTNVLNRCLRAAAEQKSVRAISVASGSGVGATSKTDAEVRLQTDASNGSGIQHVTFVQDNRTGYEIVVLLNNVGYFEGDAFTLDHFNGFSPSAAKRDAGSWISVPESNAAFASLTSSLTISSLVSQLKVPSPILAAGTRIAGASVTKILGSETEDGVKATFSLSCRAEGIPLPVEETIHSNEGDSNTSFGRWSQPVHVTAPLHAISLSKAETA